MVLYLKHRAESFLIIRGEAGPMPECSSSRIATSLPSEPPVPSQSPDASLDASPTYDAGDDELEVMKPSDVPRLVKWLEENPQSHQFALQPAFRRVQAAVPNRIRKSSQDVEPDASLLWKDMLRIVVDAVCAEVLPIWTSEVVLMSPKKKSFDVFSKHLKSCRSS